MTKLSVSYIFYIFPKIYVDISLLLPIWAIYEIKEYILPVSEGYALNEDMVSTLKHMKKMVEELENIKRTDNVKYIVDKEGNMSIDIPNSMSDDKANTLSKRIGIIDRLYNTQYKHYEELVNKDESSNNKSFSTVFNNSYQKILSRHKALIEKED